VKRALRAAAPALVALAACLVCYLASWRGTDWAAQIYRSAQVANHGLAIWDPGWYGGTFPLSYSLLYPLVASYLGLWPVAAASAAGAAFCFDRLVTDDLGRRPLASWYFAVATAIALSIGQLPTLAGEALALGCALCLAHCLAHKTRRAITGRTALWVTAGALMGAMAAVTTPIAGVFLSLSLVAWGAADLGRAPRRQVVGRLAAGGAVGILAVALPVIFSSPGYFFFAFGDLAVVLVISAIVASPWLRAPRPVRVGAVAYGAMSVALFAVRTQMGGNDVRFAAYVGAPLILCYAHRALGQRPRVSRFLPRRAAVAAAVALIVSLVAWDWAPMVEAVERANNGPPSRASYYSPLLVELGRLSGGRPVRVEIPPMAHHWESAYVAPSFPLARGWERQLDLSYAPIFYQPGRLRADAYRGWLLANGVSYVALAAAPLDFAAVREGALLRSGTVPGLERVWHNPDWQVWIVVGSAGLASAPAQVTALRPDNVDVAFASPGSSIVKVRWSPYWSLSAGRGRTACVWRSAGGWTGVRSNVAATVELDIALRAPEHGDCVRSR
jgi:hypothetical protein